LYVLMPLELADGRIMMVNRGWLAHAPDDRKRILAYSTPTGMVTVAGSVLADEPRLYELGTAPVRRVKEIWQNFDYGAYENAAGIKLVHVVVREHDDANDGLARDWPDEGSGLDAQIVRHQGYVFQWFAMAGTILVLSLYYGLRNARKP
jgi:surfeit locus 1 family protein